MVDGSVLTAWRVHRNRLLPRRRAIRGVDTAGYGRPRGGGALPAGVAEPVVWMVIHLLISRFIVTTSLCVGRRLDAGCRPHWTLVGVGRLACGVLCRLLYRLAARFSRCDLKAFPSPASNRTGRRPRPVRSTDVRGHRLLVETPRTRLLAVLDLPHRWYVADCVGRSSRV